MSSEKLTMCQVIAETSKAVRSGRIEARRAVEVVATATARPKKVVSTPVKSRRPTTAARCSGLEGEIPSERVNLPEGDDSASGSLPRSAETPS